MNKSELIEAVASAADIEKSVALRVAQAVLDNITSSLKRGEPVVLVGFGSFELRQRKARTGRNPKTGEEIAIPARRVPVFRPGKLLRDEVK